MLYSLLSTRGLRVKTDESVFFTRRIPTSWSVQIALLLYYFSDLVVRESVKEFRLPLGLLLSFVLGTFFSLSIGILGSLVHPQVDNLLLFDFEGSNTVSPVKDSVDMSFTPQM